MMKERFNLARNISLDVSGSGVYRDLGIPVDYDSWISCCCWHGCRRRRRLLFGHPCFAYVRRAHVHSHLRMGSSFCRRVAPARTRGTDSVFIYKPAKSLPNAVQIRRHETRRCATTARIAFSTTSPTARRDDVVDDRESRIILDREENV